MLALVITADRRRSRADHQDAVAPMLDAIGRSCASRSAGLPRLPFARTVGDELQGVLEVEGLARAGTLPAVLDPLVGAGGWRVGIGVGTAELNGSTTESTGPAFWAARRALDRTRRLAHAETGIGCSWNLDDEALTQQLWRRFDALPGASSALIESVAIERGEAFAALWRSWNDAGATVAAYAAILQARTASGRQAIEMVRTHRSQTRAAEALGVSPQAISKRLSIARWRTAEQLEVPMAHALERLGDAVRAVERTP